MIRIDCPFKRVDAPRLKAELAAAGVVVVARSVYDGVTAYPDRIVVNVADGTDPEAVRRVVAEHVEPAELTPEQYTAQQAKQLVLDQSAEGKFNRARDRLTVEAIQGIMAWCNGLREQLIAAGLPLSVPALQARTWEQLEERVREIIDSEVEVQP